MKLYLFMSRILVLSRWSVVVGFALLAACNRSAPANVAATVNGRAITYADLEKQFQSSFATPNRPAKATTRWRFRSWKCCARWSTTKSCCSARKSWA